MLPLIRSLNRFGIVNRVKIDRLSTSDRTASHHRTCATQVEAHTIGFIESIQTVRLGCSCSHIRRADSALDGCEARARYEESPFRDSRSQFTPYTLPRSATLRYFLETLFRRNDHEAVVVNSQMQSLRGPAPVRFFFIKRKVMNISLTSG